MRILKRLLLITGLLYVIFCAVLGHNVVMSYLFKPDNLKNWFAN